MRREKRLTVLHGPAHVHVAKKIQTQSVNTWKVHILIVKFLWNWQLIRPHYTDYRADDLCVFFYSKLQEFMSKLKKDIFADTWDCQYALGLPVCIFNNLLLIFPISCHLLMSEWDSPIFEKLFFPKIRITFHLNFKLNVNTIAKKMNEFVKKEKVYLCCISLK